MPATSAGLVDHVFRVCENRVCPGSSGDMPSIRVLPICTVSPTSHMYSYVARAAHAPCLIWGRVRCVHSERAVTVPLAYVVFPVPFARARSAQRDQQGRPTFAEVVTAAFSK